MAATVPSKRPSASGSGIAFQRPVRSFDWTSMAAVANYTRGSGCILIPRTMIAETIALGPNTGTYHFRVKTNQFSHSRVWYISLLGTTSGVATTASIAINGGTAVSVGVTGGKASVVPIEIIETVGSPSQTEQDIYVAISSSATAAVQVVSIACAEMPMAGLSYLVDGGQDYARVAPLAPVDAFGPGLVQLDTVNATLGAINAGRRVGMHHLVRAAEGSGFATSSAAFVAIYTASCEAPMLGRYLYTGDTTRTLTFKAYGKISVAGTYSVKLTMTSGATTTITTTSTSAGWFGTSNTIAVDAEDITSADGRRSTRWDLAKIEHKTSAGTGTLWSLSVWEDLA